MQGHTARAPLAGRKGAARAAGGHACRRRPPAVCLCEEALGLGVRSGGGRAGGCGAARSDGRGAAAHGRHGGHQGVHGPARGGRRAHRAAQAAARQQAARQVPGPCADLFAPAQAGWLWGRSRLGKVPAQSAPPCQVGPHLLSSTMCTLLWGRRCCHRPCLRSRQRRPAPREPSPADADLAGPGKAGSSSRGPRSASASRGDAGSGSRHCGDDQPCRGKGWANHIPLDGRAAPSLTTHLLLQPYHYSAGPQPGGELGDAARVAHDREPGHVGGRVQRVAPPVRVRLEGPAAHALPVRARVPGARAPARTWDCPCACPAPGILVPGRAGAVRASRRPRALGAPAPCPPAEEARPAPPRAQG